MKQCPKCNSLVRDESTTCDMCGYNFLSERVTAASSEIADEASILEATRNFLVNLGRTDGYPLSIVWNSVLQLQPDKPTLVLKRRLELRAELKGKLSLEEWKPLLLSSVILSTRMRIKRDTLNAITLLLPITIFGILFYFLQTKVFPYIPQTFFSGYPGVAPLIVGLFFLLFFSIARLTGPVRRRMQHKADDIVSTEFGMGGDLLHALQKIQGMNLEYRGRFANPTRDATIQDRINTLSML